MLHLKLKWPLNLRWALLGVTTIFFFLNSLLTAASNFSRCCLFPIKEVSNMAWTPVSAPASPFLLYKKDQVLSAVSYILSSLIGALTQTFRPKSKNNKKVTDL